MTISKRAQAHTASIVRPPERLRPSQYADKKVWIPSEGNAEPGKYRLSRMPHQAEMLDDPIDPGVRESFWMLASQAGGKTLCMIILCMFVVEVLKKSLLMVRATKDTALEFLRDKFLPTVEATPSMRGILKDPRQKGSGSTAFNRKFAGGSAKWVGAKSPASFRGSSQGKIFQDEIDSYEVTKEGDPCALADRAAITFSDAWKVKCSTPTLAGFSRIHAGYERGDKRKYFVPCCHCGGFQWLKDEQMKFSFTAEEHARFDPANDQATAAVANGYAWEIGTFPIRDTKRTIYVCEHCHHGWTDTQRIQAYLSGHTDNPAMSISSASFEAGKMNKRKFGRQEEENEALGMPEFREFGVKAIENSESKSYELRAHWRATAPFNGIRSRQLSGMYLTIGLKEGFVNYLHQFAEDFREAVRGGRETFMVWNNIFKAIAFEDAAEKLDWKSLKERAENYGPDLPAQVVWICFGADVQGDRVEILFWGWGEGQEAWVLERHVIYGDFDMPSMQDRVSEYLLNKRFKHPYLGEMTWSAGAFDSGHQTKVKAVYQFAAKHTFHNVWSVKGFDNALGVVYQPGKEKVHGGRRFNLNVDYLKTVIFDRLKNREPGPRYIHFQKEEVTVMDPPAVEGPEPGRPSEPTKRLVKTRFDNSFYTQLCSEKRITVKKKTTGGVEVGFEMKWVKLTSSARNEVLDMTVYAFGVYEICRQEEWISRKWEEVRKMIKAANVPLPVEGRPREVYDTSKEAKVPNVGPSPAAGKTSTGKKAARKIRINSPFRKFGY
jgi:phage terminase large subunit GpA-like protein